MIRFYLIYIFKFLIWKKCSHTGNLILNKKEKDYIMLHTTNNLIKNNNF